MPPLPDYYETLQVSVNADPEIIQAAYRKLSLKYHPDRNYDAGAESMMKALNQAYEILSDANRRKEYDASRNGHKQQHASTASSGSTSGTIVTCPKCQQKLRLPRLSNNVLIKCVGCGHRWDLSQAAPSANSQHSNGQAKRAAFIPVRLRSSQKKSLNNCERWIPPRCLAICCGTVV